MCVCSCKKQLILKECQEVLPVLETWQNTKNCRPNYMNANDILDYWLFTQWGNRFNLSKFDEKYF